MILENKTIIGIDPGLDGGIVEINSSGKLIGFNIMPTIEVTKGKRFIDLIELRDVIKSIKDHSHHIYMEKIHAMPKQGVSTMFKMGRVYGALESMIAAFQIPYSLITPQSWTKTFHAGMDKSMPTKKRSALVMQRKFPEVNQFKITKNLNPSKNYHDGLVDGFLIAQYGLSMEIKNG